MHIRKWLAGSIALLFLIMPSAASAQSIDDLMAQIAALQAQIAAMTNVSPGAGEGEGGHCLSITHNLYFGSTDAETNGDVSRLQVFLGVQRTGYFGPLTEQAVKQWQSAHGIVSSGTPNTTGYGAVGPVTRAAMMASCDESEEEEDDNITRDDAWEAIEDAEDAIADAEDAYDEATEDGSSSNDMAEAREAIDEALDELGDAKDAFNAGDYQEAYESAQDARGWAESALEQLGQEQMSLVVRSVDGRIVSLAYENLPRGHVALLWRNTQGSYEEVTQRPLSGGTGRINMELPSNAPRGNYIARAYKQDGTVSEQSSLFSYGGSSTALSCSLSAYPTIAEKDEVVRLTWTSLGANYASWDRGWATRLGLDTGKLAGNGSTSFHMPAFDGKDGIRPILNVYRDDGTSGSCDVIVLFDYDNEMLGTYVGYMNGREFVRTQDITRSDALENCELNHRNNPTTTIRCTWNGTEIYYQGPIARPTVSVSVSPSSITVGESTTLTWSSANASYCTLGDKLNTSGSMRLTPMTTTTYTVTCSNGSTSGEASATVTVRSGTATPDSFSRTPASGFAPLEVVFSGTVNGARSCGGGSQTLSFGDGQTHTIAFPADLCSPLSWSVLHTYEEAGTYTATMSGKGAASSQLLVTVKPSPVQCENNWKWCQLEASAASAISYADLIAALQSIQTQLNALTD